MESQKKTWDLGGPNQWENSKPQIISGDQLVNSKELKHPIVEANEGLPIALWFTMKNPDEINVRNRMPIYPPSGDESYPLISCDFWGSFGDDFSTSAK